MFYVVSSLSLFFEMDRYLAKCLGICQKTTCAFSMSVILYFNLKKMHSIRYPLADIKGFFSSFFPLRSNFVLPPQVLRVDDHRDPDPRGQQRELSKAV